MESEFIGCETDGAKEPNVITELLERNAAKYGGETALVEIAPEEKELHMAAWKEYDLVQTPQTESYRREITWSVFDEKANRCANLLISRGIKKGNKVAILMMNSIEWLPIYFGILKTGALAVPLNFRYSAREIKYCLDLADVDAIFFGPAFVSRMEEICDEIPDVKLRFFIGDGCPQFAENYMQLSGNISSRAPHIALNKDDNAAIYFSSGTTGFPKAILHNHESLMHAAYTEQKHHGQRRGDIFLCIPPLYHTGAKMHWFGSLISASKAVLLRGIKPEMIISAVSEEKCTIVWLLVPWAQDILDAVDAGKIDISAFSLSQWRLMHIGAQPVPQSLIKRWLKLFPHHEYDTNYGLSESIGPGCVHLGVENTDHVGAIGIPGYGWEVKIIDENGNPVTGENVGELAVKGPGVMTCYYKNPKATAEVLHDGWLWTGDMAMKDKDGFIHLVDRKKDVIISGGENIYPVQIEDYLRSHEAIKDAAVIGVPDVRLGEVSAAIIEIKDGYTCTEKEIENFCKFLPRYKRPHRIIFADIPRNPTGKIEKPKLRHIYSTENLVAKQTTA
ncbi:MAG: class I adenylate-forming enzyme family protein [Synergistes sp.]|nr:class I adenylate-forming enzyme family protein [Synergistes sp.]